MNKSPKWFIKWFQLYGLQDDGFPDFVYLTRARRIAWRAYKKGRKDMKKQQMGDRK